MNAENLLARSPAAPTSHLTWLTQLLVAIVVLALLGIAFALWEVSQVEAQLRNMPDALGLPASSE